MKLNQFTLSLTKINKTHLQFIVMLIAAAVFILGPADGGGTGGG